MVMCIFFSGMDTCAGLEVTVTPISFNQVHKKITAAKGTFLNPLQVLL